MTVLSIPFCSMLNAIADSKLQMEMLMILCTYTNEVHTTRNLRPRSIRTGTIVLRRTMNMERLRIVVTKIMTGSDAGQYFHLGKGVHLMQLILRHNPPEYSLSATASGGCPNRRVLLVVPSQGFADSLWSPSSGFAGRDSNLNAWQSSSSSFTPRQPS